MQHARALATNRLFGILCLGLALLFGAQALSNALDQLQHMSQQPHRHFVLGDLTMEQAADHPAEIAVDDPTPGDHVPPPHHHHGDVNSALPIAAPSAGFVPLRLVSTPRPIASDSPPGLATHGPERPPRTTLHG